MFLPTFNPDAKITSYINSINIYSFYIYTVDVIDQEVEFYIECLAKSHEGYHERAISRRTRDKNEVCQWMENLAKNLNNQSNIYIYE